MLYMSFSPSVSIFFLSVLTGVILGAIWVIFKIIKKELILSFKNLNLTFILDVGYFIIVSVFTICFFFLFTSGGFRAFVLIGELLGFILFKTSIEKQVYFILNFLINIIINLSKIIFKVIRKTFFIITTFSEKNIIRIYKFIKNQIKNNSVFRTKTKK